jgi:hypothetical protein
MKNARTRFLFIWIAITMLLLCTGCRKSPAIKADMSFDDDGQYTGFSNLPEDYTRKQAEQDGCYVNVEYQEVAGEEVWTDFVALAEDGKSAKIRIVYFTADDVYFTDLYYDGTSYHVFDSSTEDQKDCKFAYLLDLAGRMPGSQTDGRFVVLSNDKTLTFEVFIHAMVSSNTEVIQSIQPYRMLSIR